MPENENFRPKAITEFLDGKHHFIIPSYQRGYRWDAKEVKDLLLDINSFSQNDEGETYYLQPVVVEKDKQSNAWVVIDGQQRLTTVLLLLMYLKQRDSELDLPLYSIEYRTSGLIDFENPNFSHDINSFYISNTKNIIKEWFKEGYATAPFAAVLMTPKNKKKVKFIWYVVQNQNDIDSIQIFNNLNKGKIRLTNSELIKALFILDAERREKEKSKDSTNLLKEVDSFDTNELIYQWNEIENRLEDENFWYFLTNKDYIPSTRIDLIFDFLTRNKLNNDEDFSYRKFQNLFDNYMKPSDEQEFDSLWKDILHIENFIKAWQKVLQVYHTFIYWYEDFTMYHFIGFLIANGIKPIDIYLECENLSKSEMANKLKELIRLKVFNDFEIQKLETYSYSETPNECRKILLFFNIDSCVTQKNKSYRFPFDLYKKYNWDLEHVSSQTPNTFTKLKDRKIWLQYFIQVNLIYNNEEEKVLLESYKKQAEALKNKIDITGKDEDEEFNKLHANIMKIIPDKKFLESDTLCNLTLLDAGTNRGYGNALFPTKRKIIIQKDQDGTFIPPCTRNMFLKYYTKDDSSIEQWKNTWTKVDGKAYIKEIHHTMAKLLGEQDDR